MVFTENDCNSTIVASHIFGEDLPEYNAVAWKSGCGYILTAKGFGINIHVIECVGDNKEYVKREMERIINEKLDELEALLPKRVIGTMEVPLKTTITA